MAWCPRLNVSRLLHRNIEAAVGRSLGRSSVSGTKTRLEKALWAGPLKGDVRVLGGTTAFAYGPSGDGDGDGGGVRARDPCFHYTVLDQAWRATNTTTKSKMCDRNVKWKGEAAREAVLHGLVTFDLPLN